jgi:Fe2+ or Zn2+ uptake regulation protein
MAQFEVLKWFNNKIESGIDQSFTIKEVHRNLNAEGYKLSFVSVWNSITRLKESGFLEIKECWPIKFKAKCLKQSKGEN